jgi:hypothetical protein
MSKKAVGGGPTRQLRMWIKQDRSAAGVALIRIQRFIQVGSAELDELLLGFACRGQQPNVIRHLLAISFTQAATVRFKYFVDNSVHAKSPRIRKSHDLQHGSIIGQDGGAAINEL